MTVKSQFKFDSRIKSVDDIQTCVKYDDRYIGCNGYFFDHYGQADDLNKQFGARYGTLVEIVPYDMYDHPDDSYTKCFKAEIKTETKWGTVTGNFEYFIPEELLKPEKKYRLYSLYEWIEQHEIGDVIHYRCKSEGIEFRHVYMGYAFSKGKDITKINVGTVTLGVANYSLDYLFEDYEIEIGGEWLPFGIECEQE